MDSQIPESTCNLCDRKYSGKGMARHIRSCLKAELKKRPALEQETLLHLHVSARYDPNYFLHLLVKETVKLKDLDKFLRAIWLECCGHMSAFFDRSSRDELSMGKSINRAFVNTSELMYQYDFGSTTELVIKLAGHYSGTPGVAEKINLLARNSKLLIACDSCGKEPATEICTECQWDGEGWLCETCAHTHECGEEMLMPIANSPRAGVCAYTGDDEDKTDVTPLFVGPEVSAASNKGPAKVLPFRNKRDKISKTSQKKTNPKIEKAKVIKELIHPFCQQHLNQELEEYAFKLADTLSGKRKINITRGKIEIWAAAVVYVIARLNFLFDKEDDYHISADTVCDFFKTKKTTTGSKATQIEEACGLGPGAEGYCYPEITDMFIMYETPEGFVFPKSMLPEMTETYAGKMDDLINRELFEELLGDPTLPEGVSRELKKMLEQMKTEIVPGIEYLDSLQNRETDFQALAAEREREEEERKKIEKQKVIDDLEQKKKDDGQLSIFDNMPDN